jgi:hypothetical protein
MKKFAINLDGTTYPIFMDKIYSLSLILINIYPMCNMTTSIHSRSISMWQYKGKFPPVALTAQSELYNLSLYMSLLLSVQSE